MTALLGTALGSRFSLRVKKKFKPVWRQLFAEFAVACTSAGFHFRPAKGYVETEVASSRGRRGNPALQGGEESAQVEVELHSET
jgi:hypothetical protein